MNSKAGQYLVDKYERYIANLEWHLTTNGKFVTPQQKAEIDKELKAYQEIVDDLKALKL